MSVARSFLSVFDGGCLEGRKGGEGVGVDAGGLGGGGGVLKGRNEEGKEEREEGRGEGRVGEKGL